MLQEMSLKDALKRYIAGKRVLCFQEYEDGRMDINDLADFLEGDQLHFLVEVPAVENPEFSKAVKEMMRKGDEECPPKKNKARG